jgi:ABC-type transporter Mla subunit MlaD
MGDRYVAITVGTENEPIIPPGGIIKTQEIIELADAIEAARPALENVQNTIQNISNLTDRLASPDSDVAITLRNIKDMTTNIREGEGTIGALVQRDELYQKANDVLDSTRQTMENFHAVSTNVEEASSDFPSVMENLKSSVEKMETFSIKASAAAEEVYQLAGSGAGVMDDAQVITGNLKSATEDIKEVTPRLAPLVESADNGVAEAKEVVEAAKRSWLLRNSFEPSAPAGPIMAGERDVARPEVLQ